MSGKQVPEFLHKCILSFVHHSTKSLDALLDECVSAVHSKFHPGESVLCLEHDSACGVVVSVHDPGSSCNSPSSDKENNAEALSDHLPALLPLRYTVLLKQTEEQLTGVAHTHLSRVERLPSKDLLRLFIGSSAAREDSFPSTPWVVIAPMFAKHGLKNKIAPMFLPLSERKRMQQSQKLPQPTKKRKSISTKQSSAKKAKSTKGTQPCKSSVHHSDSDCEILANSSTDDKPKLSAKVSLSPLKIAEKSISNSALSSSKCKPVKNLFPCDKTAAPDKPTRNASNSHGNSRKSSSESSSIDDLGSTASQFPARSKISSKVKRSESRHIKAKQVVKNDTKPSTPVKKTASPSKPKLVLKLTPLKAEVSSPQKRDRGTPVKSAKTPERKASVDCNSDSSDDIKLIQLAKSPSKLTALQKRAGERNAKRREKRKERRAKERLVKPNKVPSATGGERMVKAAVGVDKKLAKDKSLRQMSLFDMGRKPRAAGVGRKSTASPAKRSSGSPVKQKPLPPCVRKLTQLIESGKKVTPHNYYLTACLKVLRPEQIERIEHEATRAMIQHRLAYLDEKRKLARMNPDERDEYIKNKKLEKRKERLQVISEKRMRFDEQLLELCALPTPQAVATPDGLPNSSFGDVALVAEFLCCFSSLLVPSSASSKSQSRSASARAPPITCTQLMDALVADADSAGYRLLTEIITMMLKTLLSDDVCQSYRELSTPLSELPVTPQTASELIRLSLRRVDDDDVSEVSHDAPDSQAVEEELSDDILCQLECGELHELSAVDRLEVMRVLVHRLLGTYALVEHQDQCDEQLRQLWIQKHAIYRQRKANRADASTVPTGSPEPQPPVPAEQPPQTSDGARSRRTRLSNEGARQERERQEQQARERRLRELERLKKEQDEEDVFRQFDEVAAHQAALVRRAALGLDRQHYRYWLLPTAPAGLYVETGWADPSTLPPVHVTHTADRWQHPSDDDDQPLAVVQKSAAVDHNKQGSIPKAGQNMWFFYDSLSAIDQLISVLAERGERESLLKEALLAHYPTLQSSINTEELSSTSVVADVAEKPDEDDVTDGKPDGDDVTDGKPDVVRDDLEPMDDGESTATGTVRAAGGSCGIPLLSSLKEDVLGVEEELTAGWLGGVPECERQRWVSAVVDAGAVGQLTSSVLLCHAHIQRRALRAPLVPAGSAGTADEVGQFCAREMRWRAAVEQCQTLSRLHLLVGMLDSSIRWDLSSAKKKCRVCRSSRDQGPASLCVQCCSLYHWSCLRPALQQPPAEQWRCPACTPREQRGVRTDAANRRARRVASESEQEESDDEDAAPVKESVCRVCQSDDHDEMITCPQCPAAFHKSCHEPPLQLRVRPGWECMDCKVLATRPSRGRGSKKPLPSAILREARALPEQASDEEEEEQDNDEEVEEQVDSEEVDEHDDGEELEEEVEKRPYRSRSSGRRRPGHVVVAAVQSDSDEDSEPTRRGSRRSRRSADGGIPQQRRSARAVRLDYRRMASADESDREDASAEEARIRQLATDESSDDGGPRQACWMATSPARRRHIRAQRRRLRASPVQTDDVEQDESPTQTSAAAADAVRKLPSPNKVEMVQQPDACCMYCSGSRTLKHELVVCQSCPNLYHRRCVRGAGLVDDWQCSSCVLPTSSRPPRQVRPRQLQDFDYEE